MKLSVFAIARPASRISAAASLLLAVSISACGPSKVEQCNALVAEANKGQEAMAHLEVENGASVQTAISELSKSTDAVSRVKVKDDKLVAIQTRYVKAQGEVAESLRKFDALATRQKALKADDVAAAAAYEKDLTALTESSVALEKETDAVVDAINDYCAK